MNSKKLNEMSNQELLKQQKLLRVITYMLAGMLLLLFALTTFLSLKKGFSALSVVPIALMPIVILNLNSLKEIKKELKSRNLP